MELSGPGFIFTILVFLGGFSALVFVHEWGHFIVARLFGVRVDTFSIGMGKEIYGRTDKNGTRWRLSAIPLGGYVKFYGDASIASNPGELPVGMSEADQAGCLHFKPLWQRALVVFAGPAVNLIVAVLIMSALVLQYGVEITEPKVSLVEAGTAADKGGVKVGDIITAVNGRAVDRFEDVRSVVVLYPGKEILVEVDRNGQQITLPVILGRKIRDDRFGNQYPYGFLGVAPGKRVILRDIGLLQAISEGTRQSVSIAKTMFTTLGEIILGIRSIKELSGPVGIANVMAQAATIGFVQFIWILGLLSLNLGIVNLLPIPILDGGHLVFYGLEALKGSPLSKKAQEASFVAGAALMLLFMVLVTLNDLQSLAL